MTARQFAAETGPDDVEEEWTNVLLSTIRRQLLDGILTDGDTVEAKGPDIRKELSGHHGVYQDDKGLIKPFRLVWYETGAKLCVYTRSYPLHQ